MNKTVLKTSVKGPLSIARRLAVVLVFFFAAQGLWGETYTWTGANNTTDWEDINNWEDSSGYPPIDYPNTATDEVTIPSGCSYYPEISNTASYTVKTLTIDSGASLKIDGALTIEDDYNLENINTSSQGQLIVKSKLTNTSDFEADDFSITFNSLDASAYIKCKSIVVSGSGAVSITGTPVLVATTTAGITFTKDVEIDASGGQFVLAGNVKASSAVTFTVNGGLLNHVKEVDMSDWSDYITVDLAGSGSSLGMQGQLYKTKISAATGDVYFVGNGTIKSMTFDAGTGCDIHFGNTTISPGNENTITLGEDITFETAGGIIIDKSCKEVNGAVTLSGINSISNQSDQLSDAIEPALTLNDNAIISGNDMSFTSVTCGGSATFNGNHTITTLTATGPGNKTLTIKGGTTTIGSASSLSGNSTNKLTVTSDGTGYLAVSGSASLLANYISLSATAPEVTAGTIYAQYSESAGTAPDGWVVSGNVLHAWKGGTAGSVSDWHTATNWFPESVPSAGDVIIGVTGNNPEISSDDISLNSITINGAGAGLLVGTNRTLTLESGCELDDRISGEGTLILSSGNYTATGAKEFNINITNNGSINADSTVTFYRNFNDSGTGFSGSIIFAGTNLQTFTPQTNVYQNITVNKSGGTLTFNGNLKVKTLALTDGDVTFTGNLSLTDGTNLQSADFTGYSDSISFTGGTSGSPNVLQAQALTLSGIIINSGNWSFECPLTIKGSFTNQDNKTAVFDTTGDVIFDGEVNSTGPLSITAANLTFKGDVNVTDITMNAVATTTAGVNIVVTGDWTNNKAKNGTTYGFTAGNNSTVTFTTTSNDTSYKSIIGQENSFYNLVFTRNLNVQTSNLIQNDFTIKRVAADNTNKGTIKFYAGTEQIVDGKVDFEGIGNAGGKRYLLSRYETTGTGKWKIKCTKAEADYDHVLKFVNIANCENESSYPLIAVTSNDSGGNINFAFPGMSYTWTGASGTSWNTPGNWTPQSVPEKGAVVTIPAVASNRYPLLEDNLNLVDDANNGGNNGSITIDQGTLDLAGYNLKVKTITNDGRVRLKGGQTITGTMKNGDDGTKGTVEYYDDTTNLTAFVWDGDGVANGDASDGKQYANLIVNKPVVLSADVGLEATGDISFAETVEATNFEIIKANSSQFDKAVEATGFTVTQGGSTTFDGAVTIGTFTDAAGAGTITFNNGGTISNSLGTAFSTTSLVTIGNTDDDIMIFGTAANPYTDLSNAAAFSHTAGATNVAGKIYAASVSAGAVTTAGTSAGITTSGAQTYSGAVTLGADTAMTSSGGSINFTSTIDSATGTNHLLTLNVPSTQSVHVVGKVGAKRAPAVTITQTGTAQFDAEVKVTDFVITQANSSQFDKAVEATSFTVTQGGSTTFNGKVTTGTFTDAAGAGTITFNNSGSISNGSGTSFSTTSLVTIGNSDDDIMIFGTVANPYTDLDNAAAFSHTAGLTNIAGKIYASSVSAGAVTTAGTTAGITTSGTQSYSDAVVLGADTTMTSGSTITFAATIDSATGPNHSLTINATSGTDFSGKIGNSAQLSLLDITGKATIKDDCSVIRTTQNQNYKGAVILETDTAMTSSGGSISFASTIDSATGTNHLLTLNVPSTQSVHVTGKIGASRAPAITITQTGTAQFDAEVKVTDFVITQASSSQFAKEVEVTNFTVTQGGSTTFNGKVTIGTFTDAAGAGTITFNNGGSISNGSGTSFSTISLLTIGNSDDDIMIFGTVVAPYTDLDNAAAFSHTAGPTNVAGKIYAALVNTGAVTTAGTSAGITTSGAQTYSGAVTLGADTAMTSSGGSINFTSTIDSATGTNHLLTLNVPSTQSVHVVGKVGASRAPAVTITQTGTAQFDAEVKVTDFVITQANSSQFDKTVEATSFTVTQGGSTTFNGKVAIGTFTDAAGAGTITFNNGGIISNGSGTSFSTTSLVTIGNSDDDIMIFGTVVAPYTDFDNAAAFSHTAGPTNVAGKIYAASVNTGAVTTAGTTAGITTSGTQSYSDAVVLGADTAMTSGSTITFAATIDSATGTNHSLTINATSGTDFSGKIGNSTQLSLLDITGKATIKDDCSVIKTTQNQNYMGSVILEIDTTFTAGTTINFASTIDSKSGENHSLEILAAATSFSGKIGNADYLKTLTVTGTAAITSGCTVINTTQGQNYNDAVTVSTNQEAVLTSIDEKIIFANAVSLEQNLKLAADGTNGGVLFDANSAVDGAKKLTITAGSNPIDFKGTVGASETINQVEIISSGGTGTTFDNQVSITKFTDHEASGDITFKNSGIIFNTAGTVFNTQGVLTLGNSADDQMTFGTTGFFANFTHTAGDTNITGTLNAADITLAQTAGGPMTITNTGLFKTIDGADLTYTTGFTQNGTGNSVLGGSFTGNGDASFATNVQLNGTPAADFGSNGTTVSVDKNLIIIRDTTGDLNINSHVNVTENLVLYKGPVIASADITAGKDFLVLGTAYSLTDTSTGITNEYAYACVRPSTWGQPNYTESLLPDGTAVPELVEGPLNEFSSTLYIASGKTISAGKNFYANGTTLQTAGGTGQWSLKVPDLTNPANGFAEAYHSKISGCKVICSDGTSDGSKARLVALECTDEGDNAASVDFDDFEITAAYTERDNAIRVEFNRPVRYYNATVQTLKFQNAGGTPALNFTGLYSDPDCQNEIEYDTQMSYFYIKAAPQNGSQYGAWNTDATGRSSGADDDQSTDRSGIHHETIPALDFARSLVNSGITQSFIFTDRWGKRLNNYSSRTPTSQAAYGSTDDADAAHNVADKTGPVLYSVRTGQELHDAYNPSTGAASEHSYDSHNFIEFVYSEKVDFDGSSDDTTLNDSPATAENVQVNDAVGAVKGDITKSDNLQLAGLGILEHGLLNTGSAGNSDKYVNALYRKGDNAEYSIRLSIAGYTDPVETLTDDSGYTYKKWLGYIEEATLPSGTVKHLVDSNKKNERVKDKEGNVQIKYAENADGESVFDTIPVINSTEDGLYGAWDLSEPVFALYRQNAAKTLWEQAEFNKNYYAEAIGNNSGVGSTLDRIEFHLYDNTPDFETTGVQPEWFTEVGWCNPNSIGEKPQDLYKSYSYAADIFGGARPFDNNAARRTSGGIRYSTIHSSVNAFKYGVGSALQEGQITTTFNNSKTGIPGASSLIFTGTSSPRRSAGDSEGLYFALPLANTSLDIKTSFTVKYDDSVGFITDLAGNRLRTKIFSTIDRTPPSIDMTVCPVGGDEMEIIFVKELCIDSDKLEYNDNTTGEKVSITEQFDTLITNCFDFITINSSGTHQVATDLSVDHTVPAKITVKENQNGSAFTIIRLKLSRTITLDDIKNKFIRVIYVENYGEYSVDLFTGHPGSRVTFIQDEGGNNIQMYTAHALSDFAVGVINPLYAYDSSMTEDDGTIISDSIFRANKTEDIDSAGWSVHDWNRDQKNYGTLPAKRPVAIVADTSDGTETNENALDSFRLYLSNNPDAASVSTQYNKDLEPSTSWRIWLPDEMTGVFTSLSEKNNTNYSQVDGTLLSDKKTDRLIFDVGETITNQWAAGNQISFLFGLTNSDGTPVTIMHSPELDINNDKQYLSTSAKMPLFALRQTDPLDLLSLDLWSFRLKDVVSQRGGVTIMNNVINAAVGEKVVLKVDVPEDGNLTVVVMTLDGNIVDYLNRGMTKQGEHFYSWDGRNRKGRAVARGMYFIRVSGPGIDETRKVMVVKE